MYIQHWSWSKSPFHKATGVESIGSNLISFLRKRDKDRPASAAQKVSDKYKSWRFNRRKDGNVEAKEVVKHYEAGGFDCTGEKSQILRGIKRRGSVIQHDKKKKLRIQAAEKDSERFHIVGQRQEDMVEISRPTPVKFIVPFNLYK